MPLLMGGMSMFLSEQTVFGAVVFGLVYYGHFDGGACVLSSG